MRILMVDVDGVVVRHPEGLRWDRDLEADLGIRPEDLQTRFFKPHFEEVVLGRAGLHERLAPVLAEIAPHLSAAELTDYWFAKDAHLDHQLLQDLAEVRARGVALHLATVQEHMRAHHLWSRLGLSAHFDEIHYAAALGCKKPQPEFFAAVARRTGCAPAQLLLLDDSSANVQAARAAGWDGALWDGTRRLPHVLEEAGL